MYKGDKRCLISSFQSMRYHSLTVVLVPTRAYSKSRKSRDVTSRKILGTMFSNTLFIFLTIWFLLDISHGQRSKKFFRTDYTYIEGQKSFYKIHTTPQTWFDAKRKCAEEGASLYYPKNEDEQNAVKSFRKNIQPHINWVYIGMSDLLTEGFFETIDGKSVSEVYNNWESSEPNDAGHKEDCVQQNLDGRMNDRDCSDKERFICKKSLLSLKWNYRCNMPILDYTLNMDTGKCYKLHRSSFKWSEAYAVCRSEQSRLAMFNNRSEADYFAKLVETASKQRIGGYHELNRGIYHLGFQYRFKEGWRTVSGTPLAVADDAWWDKHEPIVDEHEQCGSMFYNGRLNSVNCDTKSFFICEHDVDNSAYSVSTEKVDI